MSLKRRVLFLREFLGFTGGHLKVWHYFCHLLESARFRPEIYLTSRSQLDAENPWIANNVPLLRSWNPKPSDIVFLAGLDWMRLPDPSCLADSRVTIVNLVQSTRHADSRDPRFAFLRCFANRICVSEEIRNAVRATGLANGPMWTVRAATDLEAEGQSSFVAPRVTRLLIAGSKNPEFGKRLSDRLTELSISHCLLTQQLPRYEFLRAIRESVACVFLPSLSEGFYLPPLEAMALRTLVICPDCVGNRGSCPSTWCTSRDTWFGWTRAQRTTADSRAG